MYLPDALRCKATVALRSKSLIGEEGAIDPDEAEKEGCTYTAMRNWNKSYYTGAIKASKLHILLSNNHRADREGIHISVGDIKTRLRG